MSLRDLEKDTKEAPMVYDEVEASSDGPVTTTWTPEEEKKLVRKVDLFLMPTIWIMYLLSYMDRTVSIATYSPIGRADRNARILEMQKSPA
jgi:hypothetical protein